jgi:cell division protease FtsH
MKAKFRNFFQFVKENKSKTAVIVFLLGVSVVMLTASSVKPATVKGRIPVTPAAQTKQVTTMNPLVSTPATKGRTTPEALPVVVVPYSDWADMLQNNPAGTFTTAFVNPAVNTTAVVMKKPYTPETIIATAYLPTDTAKVYSVYRKMRVSTSIVPTQTTVNPTVRGPINPYTGMTEPGSTPKGTGSTASAFKNILSLTMIGLFIYFLISAYRTRGNMAPSTQIGSNGFDSDSNQGNKKNKNQGAEIPKTRFKDVAGCDEAIEDMREMVMFLKEPERFTAVGAKPPTGALLVGPPGTGKTLLARAVAGEAGVPFFTAAGSDFVEMYVGVGAKRVRELFKKAKTHPAAIIFIDEIDAVGKARGNSKNPNGNQEQESTLNALLVEMDGFEGSNVIVLAATNRSDVLDKALTRPGRLDRAIQVPLPDRKGRLRILKVHSKDKPFEKEVDLDLIARRTPGMSGADLSALVNEACMVAAREKRTSVTSYHFDTAIANLTMGKARVSAVISDADRRLTAWHEAGHAVCGLVQTDAPSPVSISIIPRGQAGGVTHFPSSDSGYMTRRAAYAQLVTGMGGLAAERMLYEGKDFTTGPSSDLQVSTQLALGMVTSYGMGDRLLVRDGLLGAGGDSTDQVINEADDLLHSALKDATKLLLENESLFTGMIDALLELETLTTTEIDALVKGKPVVPHVATLPEPHRPVKKTNLIPAPVVTVVEPVGRGGVGVKQTVKNAPKWGAQQLRSMSRTRSRKTLDVPYVG